MGELGAARSLESRLAEARPSIERLEEILERSQVCFDEFEEKLRHHTELLQDVVPSESDEGDGMATRLEELTELVRGLGRSDETGGAGSRADREERARELDESVGRNRELEEQLRVLHDELERAQRARSTEEASLAERLRVSEMARIEAETRHTEDITQFADHSRQRLEALMGELEIVRSALDESERERDSISALAIEKERQLADLYTTLSGLCDRNAADDEDAETVEAVQALIRSKSQGVSGAGALLSDPLESGAATEADAAIAELPEQALRLDGADD